ncbi:MAG: D-2-hydroxyacid dehydrogenase [Planctomycetota bacterium]|jgi:phosphoglycerate dehydrogenase-like enzyme|nr:D-2-hydroxyacid dehydrogenase [Planctomycetota bacterium]MDP7133508.1 D-2-hydroxyacid dehydrogenase [Planctomycetota bacterium]
MGYKLVICPPWPEPEWPDLIHEKVLDCELVVCESPEEAMDPIIDADAAFGDIVPELFEQAKKLRWIQAPLAGLGANYFHEALVKSDVVVTNMRGIYSDHIANMVMSYLLAFARGLPHYWELQREGQWGPAVPVVHLGEAAALIIGVGGIGYETARLCKAFGMKVMSVDPRVQEKPDVCDVLATPDELDDLLPEADFVVMTCPETPDTLNMMNADRFGLMKSSAYFINISRAGNVDHDALVDALQEGTIAGAALDVTNPEPLPPDHVLWTLKNAIITPHMAAAGPYIAKRRTEVFINNCIRFGRGQELLNVVNKSKWF